MKCDTCKHAQPLTGVWHKLSAEFVRCVAEPRPESVFITAKANPCSFTPPKWEKR